MDPKVVPVNLGTSGMWQSGEPTSIPDGFVRSLRNMLLRPNRIAARPPFVYDNLMAIAGLMRWEDLANQQTRFLALDTSFNLYMKAASGETWSGAITGTTTASRITDFANYRGKVYYMIDDGAGNPAAAAVFDGTTISDAPFNSTIFSKTVTTFVDRLIFGAPRVTVTPSKAGFGLLPAIYNNPTLKPWGMTNILATFVTVSSGVVCRLLPTSTTASSFSWTGFAFPYQGPLLIPASQLPTPIVWRSNMRNLNASVEMPVTLEFILTTIWGAGVAYTVGSTISDGTNIQRVTVAGTSGGAAPAWAATVGATTADGAGTLVWVNEGSAIIGSMEAFLPPATEADDFETLFLSTSVRSATNSNSITVRCKFFNSAVPTITLSPVDMSFRDGLADGDARKANKGQQITIGDFFFPFVNTETASSATISLSSWIYSETTQPKVIRAANTEEPQEAAGLPTAACVLSGRFIGFKRRAFWVFKGTADPDNPLLPESPATMADGCLGPRAVAVIDDEAFFIGENEIYSFRVGGYPRPLCGDAMFETIMRRGSDWVENQSVYNMPLLAIDRAYGELWVYTQKGKLFCYHMPESSSPSAASALFSGSANKGSWTTHDVGGLEVAAMAFNPITQEMEFSFGGHGLARLDASVTAQDTVDNTGTLYPVTKDIILKPFELYSPRYELCLHDIGIYHLATYTQAGEALWAYISFDRGATYPKFNEVRFDTANPRIPISIFQAGLSVQPKISHVGSAGEAAWCVSRGEATLELMSGEWPLSRPTQIASSL